MSEALLDIAELVKRFPVGNKRLLHAVDEVTLTIGRGETVGLVGESGCGKSTLVRLINRLLDPTSGSIRLARTELADMKARDFAGNPNRKRIQMVFQDAGDSLNPRYTAADAIADPLRRLRKMSGATLRERVDKLADMTGLPRDLLTRFPHQLSGGQKARVGIARAIAVEPELLILDEPTAALDVSVQVVILQLLLRLKQELGMSYLFVSHDLNVVHLLCDRVLVMYLGKIVEQGPAAEIFAGPKHPYTRALISAIPQADPDKRIGRLRLSGEPRSPIDPDPTVCRFYGRCPRGEPRCSSEMPVLRTVGPARQVACHFA
ncbi:ABC transporter ATP-binding protein [Reyranella sp.]|uniref:ABC transporter ATP-binding protein n=1 Tax=Reyranella sp. TaxID=1929291 RepID=UPI0037832949